ncbi:MOSC domain-containing protein [Solicola sp. PLA-1-18]|uniref:MOSC domain-containing protein n=1 Tax=Solicola sp. PLA-1-18 TaxID=3380532 RepID=UPI003B7DF8B1
MRVVSLHRYPVKSVAPVDLDESIVQPWGLAGDRRYMLVTADGTQVTAREHPALLTVHAVGEPDTGPLDPFVLTVEGAGPLLVAPPAGPADTWVSVWRTRLRAADVGDAAARWFSSLLGLSVRLVFQDDPRLRPVGEGDFVPADSHVSLADGSPLLLTTEASLARLGEWIAERGREDPDRAEDPVPMRRFRPNLVVDGDEPFAEDTWRRVQVGGATFAGTGPCPRCVMTLRDPDTLERGREPIRTLARHRSWDGSTWFGINLVPVIAPGSDPSTWPVVRVGDEVTAR